MTIREIQCRETVGIDFGDYAGDPSIVAQGLQLLTSNLPNCIGYYLKLRTSENGSEGWFEPECPSISLPRRVELLNLLPDTWKWPVVAEHLGNISARYSGDVDVTVAGATWRGQVRIQAGRDFIGYFKMAYTGPHGSAPSDRSLLQAAYSARLFVDEEVWKRNLAKIKSNDDIQRLLSRTHREVDAAIVASKPRSALRHMASLITSHLWSGLNRIAIFVEQNEDSLECVYAHGGPGAAESGNWGSLQEYLGTVIQNSEQLHSEIRRHEQHDPYSDAAAGRNPVRVETSRAAGLLGEIWRNQGDLHRIPEKNQIYRGVEPHGSDRRTEPCAAMFGNEDPWLVEVRRSRPDAAVFASRSGLYFVLPWFLAGTTGRRKLIGLVVVDQAYWATIDLYRDIMPRLRLARIVLDDFGSHFEALAKARIWH